MAFQLLSFPPGGLEPDRQLYEDQGFESFESNLTHFPEPSRLPTQKRMAMSQNRGTQHVVIVLASYYQKHQKKRSVAL